MRAEWQTPIYHVSYAAVRKDLSAVTSRVGQLVLQHYDALLKENDGRLVHNAWSPNGVNQVRGVRLLPLWMLLINNWHCGPDSLCDPRRTFAFGLPTLAKGLL
jgi:hypothetical protein